MTRTGPTSHLGRTWSLVAAVLLCSCKIELDGARCPCATGFVCCASDGRCHRSDEACAQMRTGAEFERASTGPDTPADASIADAAVGAAPSTCPALDGKRVYRPTDVDGDGHGDVVFYAVSAVGSVGLYMYTGGNKNIFWQTRVTWFQDDRPMKLAKIAVADMNHDGCADVVLAQSAGDERAGLSLLRGSAKPMGLAEPVTTLDARLEDMQLAAGDLTGDGFADLLIYTHAADGLETLSFLAGSSQGLNSSRRIIRSGTTMQAAARIALSDANGDGTADIVLARPGTGDDAMEVSLIDGGPHPEGPEKHVHSFTVGASELQMAGGDVNGDGYGDLVLHGNHVGGVLYLLSGSKDGFVDVAKVLFAQSGYVPRARLALTDAAGNGAVDIVLVRPLPDNPDLVEFISLPDGMGGPGGYGERSNMLGASLDRITL